VVTIVSSTSTSLSGSFDIIIGGDTASLAYDSSADAMANAIESISSYNVDVSRNTIESDGAYEWIITFLIEAGDEPSIEVVGTSLQGTLAVVTVDEIQKGSHLQGSYSLSFGGETIDYIPYDCTVESLKALLGSLKEINQVNVTLDVHNFGRRYLITFIDPVGDNQLLLVNSESLVGSDASVRIYEVQKGTNNRIIGYFFIVDEVGSITTSLSVDTSAVELETKLRELTAIGDIEVSKFDSSTSIYPSVEWLVTFTTLGSPSNAGDVPLLKVHDYTSTLSNNFVVNISKVQSGCCDVRISYNGEEDSFDKISIIVDAVPTVAKIYPRTGFVEGNVNVTIVGSGFHSSDSDTPYCLFGSVETVAHIHNITFASCISPPHPAGTVIVTLKFFYHYEKNAFSSISRSVQTFLYEGSLMILSHAPAFGQIDETTEVSSIRMV